MPFTDTALKPKDKIYSVADSRACRQKCIQQTAQKADIHKPISFVAYATRSGTDLRYIKEVLGHRSSKTTEIYTHVSTRSIQNVVSPFDTL